MKKWRVMFKRKQVLWMVVAAALVAVHTEVMAGDGAAGIAAAESQIKSYFGAGEKLMYVIGAVVGLIGAVKVFNKWNSGDQDTSKVAAAWFGSCIFLVVVAKILSSFFL